MCVDRSPSTPSAIPIFPDGFDGIFGESPCSVQNFGRSAVLNIVAQSRRIDLADDELEAVSCFLEYLYTGEYFPRKLTSGILEADPSNPTIDDSGDQLLKHAKVYTLAEKLGVPVRLAHCLSS